MKIAKCPKCWRWYTHEGRRVQALEASHGARGALRRNNFGHADGGKDARIHGGVLLTTRLIQASYTAEGVRGLLKDGGGRQAAVDKMIEGLGGVSECFYFAFGENDVYAIAQLPDNATAAAVSLAIAASGAVTSSFVVLLTPEEVHEAAGRPSPIAPRAPGPRENSRRSQQPAGPSDPGLAGYGALRDGVAVERRAGTEAARVVALREVNWPDCGRSPRVRAAWS